MGASSHLYELIQGLSQSERRYFLLFSKAHSGHDGSVAYMRLYKYLIGLTEFDDVAIREYCKENGITKNFPVEKNYLYNKLLGAFRGLYANDGNDALADIIFLYKKGMLEAMYKKYKAHYKNVRENLFYTEHFQLLQFEKEVAFDGKAKFLKKTVEEIFADEETLLNALLHLNKLKGLKNVLLARIKIIAKATIDIHSHEIEKIYRDSELHYLQKTNCPRCAVEYLVTKGFYCHYQRKYKKARNAFLEAARIFQHYPKWKKQFQKEYRKLITNLLNCSTKCHSYQDFEDYLPELKSLKSNFPLEAAENFQCYYQVLLLYLSAKEDFDGAGKLAGPVKEGIEKYGELINPNRKVTLLYNLTLLHFIGQNYTEAFSIAELIVHARVPDRKDLQVATRLLLIMIQYETGDIKHLQSQVSLFHKYLAKSANQQYDKAAYNKLTQIILEAKEANNPAHLNPALILVESNGDLVLQDILIRWLNHQSNH